MTFILISGESNVGKTHVCQILRDILDQDLSFNKHHYPKSRLRVEVLRHYEKNGKHIVLNSPSDNNRSMERLAEYLDDFGAPKGVFPDIIITSIRETGDPKYRMLALLKEVAKKKPINLVQHYNQNIANITTFVSTALGNHASWIYLTKQPVSGNLVRYWNDNANDAKAMLDNVV